MPVDVEKFMSVRIYKHQITGLPLCIMIQMPSWDSPSITDDNDSRLLPPTTQTELEVITAIQNLGNTVIANAASRSLTKYVQLYHFKIVP